MDPDQSLFFFNEMLSCIPQNYIRIEKQEQPTGKKANRRNKDKPQAMSMVDLKLKAQEKIEAIQQTNRDKSQAKIKQLTLQHQKMPKVDKQEGKPDKSENKEKPEYKSKGKLDETKLDNKRKQKQANKAKKINKGKGIAQPQAPTN